MKRATKLSFLLGALLAGAAGSRAQSVSVATDPVGFVSLATLSNSDTIFSTPLAQPETFRGSVSALSGAVLTAAGAPGWTAGGFVYVAGTQSNTYYIRFRTGAKKGFYYTVTANTTNSLTIDPAGDVLTGVVAGDEFALIPYWTLGTVFPASAAGAGFQASNSSLSRNTEIFFPDQVTPGTNLAPNASYFFLNGAWRKFGGSLATSFNDTVLPPDSYVTVRNKAFTGSVALMGGVVTAPQTAPVNSFAAAQQDNFMALNFPVAVSLNSLGLAVADQTASAVRTSPSAFNRVDQVFLFDNTVPGINKSPAATYFFANGAWRKFGSPVTQDFGTDVIQPGSGFILRRGADASGPRSVDWSYIPPSL